MPEEHAFLSASGAHRWINCTPAAMLEKQVPDNAGSYAAEGTLAHSLAELKLRKQFEIMKPSDYKQQLAAIQADKLYQPEMDGYTDTYVDHIRSLCMAFPAMPYVVIEKRLDFSHIVPGGFGTGDCVILYGDTLHICDLKYGKGVPVSAENNPQLRLYALGAIHEYSLLYDIKEVQMHIIQPRLDNISTDTLTADALRQWGDSVKPLAEQATNGTGEFHAGDWCRFCRAKAQCRARAVQMLEIGEKRNDTLLSDAEIGEILTAAQSLQSWVKSLEEYAEKQLIAGKEIPGWKLVEGRSNRTITDTEAAFQVLEQSGYDEALLYERKPLNLTALEKLCGKKHLTELIGNYIVKPPGKPTVVPTTDKRRPYAKKKLEEMFGGK
ncbi:DUF2800 domain-containing protein [Ruminococcus sp.]|uniref:DUF2800 domain-containing protein n=1 Tax=Ruminococcus sp. TaxID=41978 RepID=UPI0025FFBEA7|nr:DUF2800 domain-containing protein [Ruminococcus sp.]